MDVSRIELEGILYDIKDAKAREMLTPQELATNTDANSVVDTGMYYFNYKKTYSNIPASNGWLIVSKVADTIVKQLFFRHGTANTNDYQIYVRTKIGSVWSDWTRMITTKDIASTSAWSSQIIIKCLKYICSISSYAECCQNGV